MAKVTQLLSAHSTSLETEEEKTGVGERCFQNCKEYIGVGKNLNTIQSIFRYRYGRILIDSRSQRRELSQNFNTEFIFSGQEPGLKRTQIYSLIQ